MRKGYSKSESETEARTNQPPKNERKKSNPHTAKKGWQQCLALGQKLFSRVLPTLIFYIADFLYGSWKGTQQVWVDIFWLKTRPHIWPLVYDYWSLAQESKVYFRVKELLLLTCCRQLGQRGLSIVIAQQQQQDFNYNNDKNASIVKQKHCNLAFIPVDISSFLLFRL